MGNLYQTRTTKGHVKWICIDHHRENNHEKVAKAFINTVKGPLDVNKCRMQVASPSRVQADQLHQTLEKAISVFKLRLDLDLGHISKRLQGCKIRCPNLP